MNRMKASFIEGIKTKEYLEFLLDSAPYAVISTDVNGKIVSFNKAAEEMYGYKESEVQGKDARMFQLEDEAEELSKDIYKEMLAGEGWEGEILNKKKSGDVFPVYLRARKIMGADGRAIGLLSFAADISDRKKASEEFGRLKGLSESIIMHATIGIFTLDHAWTVSSVNPALLKLIGAKKSSDVVGLNFRETPMYKAFGGKSLEEKLKREGNVELRKAQYNSIFGKKVFVDTSATVLKSGARVIGTLFLLQDIEEQAELEEQLKNRAQQLESSNKMKELFIDIIRHDLINPLGIIKNFSELLLEEESDGVKKNELEAIKNNAQRVVDLIEDVKTFARVEKGTGNNYTVMNLGGIISNTIESHSLQLEEREMKVNFNPHGDYLVRVNPFIDEAFSNILSNAIKYSPKGSEIQVIIKDFGEVWRVQFKDEGPGIPENEKLAIFERFKRIKRGSIKGTGLGLAIVKSVVEMHNGRVWVEDNPGGGSVFNVELQKVKGV